MALQSREDPVDVHLACRREPAWRVLFLSQVPAPRHPLPDHQRGTAGQSTAGLPPQAEPLAHDQSLTLLSRTAELLWAHQRLCPVGRQGGGKRSKSLLACFLLGRSYPFPRKNNSLHAPDRFSKYTANSSHSPSHCTTRSQEQPQLKHRNGSHPTCPGSGLERRAVPKHAITLGQAHPSSFPFQPPTTAALFCNLTSTWGWAKQLTSPSGCSEMNTKLGITQTGISGPEGCQHCPFPPKGLGAQRCSHQPENWGAPGRLVCFPGLLGQQP